MLLLLLLLLLFLLLSLLLGMRPPLLVPLLLLILFLMPLTSLFCRRLEGVSLDAVVVVAADDDNISPAS